MNAPLARFRPPFTLRNSAAAIRRFPYPFATDRYEYSVNLEPHVAGGPGPAFDAAFDIDEHYLAEHAHTEAVLAEDPARCQLLPGTEQAEWDCVELLMTSLARDFPRHFALRRDGERWHWTNHLIGSSLQFVFGDRATLPHPFETIARQVQGDLTLQEQRGRTLVITGGMLTTQSDWSLDFVLGSDFHALHGPAIPAHDAGVFDRALAFLLALPVGAPVRRVNWSITINPWLDTATETAPRWAPDRARLTQEQAGEMACLRVELQNLHRLPRSHAILFHIRTYLLRFGELVQVAKWARRTHRVLAHLPPGTIDYKGLAPLLPALLGYLAAFDDGAPTSPGTAPDPLT